MKENTNVEYKVTQAVDLYLDKLLEPQILQDATLAQITKTLEMLLSRFPEPAELPQKDDPLSLGLKQLAQQMELEAQDDLP